MPSNWTCPHCAHEQPDAGRPVLFCEACERPKAASFEIQLCEHILEHIADGVTEPLRVLEALIARPCYQPPRVYLDIGRIARYMRLLTKDTTQIARNLLKAKAANMALQASASADAKDLIAILKGIQVLGDVVEHKGELITKHVVELHEGPPPKRSE